MVADPDATAIAALAAALRGVLAPIVHQAIRDALSEFGEREQASPWLTIEQAAQYLGCSRSTIARLRTEGAPFIALGDSPRIRHDALDAWLLTREHHARASDPEAAE